MILMMLNIKESASSLFCLQCEAQTIGRDSSDRERKRKRGQNVFDERINVYTYDFFER